MKRNNEEYQTQCAFVEWFNLTYPDILFYHTPNGGQRNKLEAYKLKKMFNKIFTPLEDW